MGSVGVTPSLKQAIQARLEDRLGIRGPDAPGLLWEALRYALIAAAALVLGGRILGLERHGLFVVSYIAFQFAYAFLMPLLFASLISMPVHAVVSPLFGVDVWIVWRPLLHVAFAVGLALMSLKMHFDEAHTYYEGDTAPRYRRPRFRGRVGTGAVAFGEMVGSLSRPSGDSAGGSWSDDSDGGDSD